LSATPIQAIETRYAGCRFRSRLEARWAVFFDHLDIRWEYEAEGFDTSAGKYLPDFRIKLDAIDRAGPMRWSWFEVKREDPEDDPRHAAFTQLGVGDLWIARGIPSSARDQWRRPWLTRNTEPYILVYYGFVGWPVLARPRVGTEQPFDDEHLDIAFAAARSFRAGEP
jgi:hypothetical protein